MVDSKTTMLDSSSSIQRHSSSFVQMKRSGILRSTQNRKTMRYQKVVPIMLLLFLSMTVDIQNGVEAQRTENSSKNKMFRKRMKRPKIATEEQRRELQQRRNNNNNNGRIRFAFKNGETPIVGTKGGITISTLKGAKNTNSNSNSFTGNTIRNENVPMVHWSWGTIWVDQNEESTFVAQGNAGANIEGAGGRKGTVPKFLDQKVGNAGTTNNQKGVATEGNSNNNNNNNNGAESPNWMSNFVQEITPRPTPLVTSPPTPPPLPPTLSPVSSTATQSSGQCQLCSNGGTATQTSRTLIGTTVTCQDLVNSFESASAQDCAASKQSIPINIEGYCGCPGVTIDAQCTFCPAGKDDIWYDVNIPALNNWTCQDAETYTYFITDTQACSEMTAISDICCGTWEEYWGNGTDDGTWAPTASP